MKKMRLKKVLGTSLMAIALMVCSLGMTAHAAYATLTKNYSSGKGTVTLCNMTQTYRFGEVIIHQYNAGGSKSYLGRNWGRLNSGDRVSLTKTITKACASGTGYLHDDSYIDSKIIYSNEVKIK